MATTAPTLGGNQPIDIAALIAQILGQQQPQARMVPQLAGGPPPLTVPPLAQEPQGEPMPPMLGNGVPPLAPRGVLTSGTPGSMLPPAPAAPVASEPVPSRLPSAAELRPDFAAAPSRAPLGPPRPIQPPPETPPVIQAAAGAIGPFTTETQPAPQETPVDGNAIVQGATAAAASRGPSTASPATPTGSPSRTALRQPGALDFIDTALAGMAGGRPVLSTMGDRFEGRNATYDALIQRGASPELARAITLNPAQFGTVLPSLFSPKTAVVNNRLVDTTSGRVIADFSDRFAPLQPGAGALNTSTGEMREGGPRPLTADDRRAVRQAEDSATNVRATRTALQRARELNDQTFTGITARARGFLGTSVPGGGMLVDPAAATATRELDQILSLESIKQMSDTLKGATTDRELFEFQRVMSDPTTPPDIRGRIIDRMLQLVEAKIADDEARATEIRGGTYYRPGGGQSRSVPRVTNDAEYDALPSGARFVDPEGKTRVKP